MNYLSKPSQQNDEYYCEEDSYAVNEQTWISNRMPKVQIRRINTKVKEKKVGTMLIITVRVIMSELEITIATTTSTEVTILTEMIGMGPMFLLKIVKLFLGMVEVVWRESRICCTK